MTKDHWPDFSGKCLSLKITHSDHSHDLYDPSFEYQAGRLFLVGTIPPGSSASGWDENQTGAVAWDLVRNYIVFSKAVEISDRYEEDESGGRDA